MALLSAADDGGSRPDPGGSRASALDELDPDLFAGMGPAARARVGELPPVRVVALERGRWEPRLGPGADSALGLLLVDGMLARNVFVGGDVVAELVGPGDMIRPWETTADGDALVPCRTTWNVLEPTRLAVLGQRFAAAAARCPELTPALLDRTVRRARSQGIFVSIAHTKRIDERLVMLLWHMAERWGRVTGDGVVVPVALTHRRLAELVGAQRPSVTAALTRLASRGVVTRTPARGFVLTASAQSELEALSAGGDEAVRPLTASA